MNLSNSLHNYSKLKQLSIYIAFIYLVFGTHNINAQSHLKYEPTRNGELVEHKYYSLSYVEDYEQAEWVYYALSPQLINGHQSRTDNFREDPHVSTQSATLSDYKGSGYDRGHLCPAGSMKQSTESMSESFYLSNMAPQNPSFNRGAWKNLEAIVRNWAIQDQLIYVVSGGVLNNIQKHIGNDKVAVPNYFYKIVYSPSRNEMIAFIMPNEKISDGITNYICSVDKVEKATDIDFFPQLNDQIENKLEARSTASAWSFEQYKSTSSNSQTVATNTRCKAITSKGTQCKRNATEGSKYCWQHKQ